LADLRFRPLQNEHYDFAIPASRWDRPAVRALRKLLEPGSALPSNIHSVSADANGELYVLGIRDLGGGDYDGWVVSLVPEPSSGVLLVLAMCIMLRLRTRQRE
jgi:hypothetical protein